MSVTNLATPPHFLVVCAKNQWRSPTAEAIYRGDPRVELRSAGVSPRSVHLVSQADITWADLILCMEQEHKERLHQLFPAQDLPPIEVLDIPDEYQFMDAELVELLRFSIEEKLQTDQS